MSKKPAVLIIDDDANLCKTLTDILRVKGYAAASATTGQAALAAVQTQPPAVALIDLKLVDMSGLEVMGRIKRISPHTECIVLTGHASQASAIEAIHLGAYSYLQKPYEVEQLLLTIRRAIERQETVTALQESEERYRSLFERVPIGLYRTTAEGKILDVNPALAEMLGYPDGESLRGASVPDSYLGSGDRQQWVTEMEQKGIVRAYETLWRRADGASLWVYESAVAVRDAAGQILYYEGAVQDISERKEAQRRLVQAEKMSAIGQLAGGIAHDFHNLLTVIHLSIRLLEKQLHPQDPLWTHVQRIQDAGQRATALTRQLLSFSRKEVVELRLLNLNEVIGDLSKMLQRIIGEDIELVMDLAEDLWPVHADPSQVDQVLMNVVVNARDAMPGGGRLIIETANVVLDEGHARRHLDARPGAHVQLTLADTGVGMDETVKARIFEPFFTTKERGKGTGLGLATVYGIVTQSEGHIVVDSEPGHGTTFRIYWPRAEVGAEAKARAKTEPSALASTSNSNATILLVEDSDDVRELTVDILREEGYRVLAAGDGAEALRLARDHEGPIHLLLTDVVMPHMSGQELAKQIKLLQSEIKILYISGYTDDRIAHHGVLEEGVAFLRKPFDLESLTQKVQATLDAGV